MPITSFAIAKVHTSTFQVSDQKVLIHHCFYHKQKAVCKTTDHLALYKSELMLEITLRGDETVTIVKEGIGYFVPQRCGLILSLWVLFFARAFGFCLKVENNIVIEQHTMYQQTRQLQALMCCLLPHWCVTTKGLRLSQLPNNQGTKWNAQIRGGCSQVH